MLAYALAFKPCSKDTDGTLWASLASGLLLLINEKTY